MLPWKTAMTLRGTCFFPPSRILFPYVLVLALLNGCTPPAERDAQWEFLQGPYAREITALLPLRQAHGLLLTGMVGGDVFYSPSSGRAWLRRSSPDPGRDILRFVQHPDSASLIYACTGGGLFLTRDEARSWHPVAVAEQHDRRGVLTVAFDPWNTHMMFAGTDGMGIRRSTDNGSTWASLNGQKDSLLRDAEVTEIRVDPEHPDRIFAALGTRGLALSENGGTSWNNIVSGQATVSAAITSLLLKSGDTATLMYGTSAGSMYRSTNRGDSWSPSREASPGDRIRTLAAVPTRTGNVIAGTETGAVLSPDFGERWRPAAKSLPRTGISLALGPESQPVWYAFSPAFGLRMSTDSGESWLAIDANLGGATAQLVASDPATRSTFIAAGSTLLRAAPDSAVWVAVSEGLTGGTILSFAFDRYQAGAIYATTALGAFRSQDQGATWEPFARYLSAPPTQLVAHPWFSSRFLSSTPNGNYYSTDRGSTWRECRPFSKTPPACSFTFRPTDAGAVYAAAGTRGVLLSSDGGITWDVTRYGLEQDSVVFVSLDTNDRNTCYAWTIHGHCYRSLSGGLEWGRFTPPWESHDSILVAIDPLSPSHLVALANGKTIFVTGDGGTTWVRILERRLPALPISLAWNHQTGCLLAGTRHGGIYRIDLTLPLTAVGRDREF
jgi:photosystem II stability/assembly factor-like uncharacterized protein